MRHDNDRKDNPDDDRPGLTGDLEGTILSSFKAKLVETKKQWARDGRAMSGMVEKGAPPSRRSAFPRPTRHTRFSRPGLRPAACCRSPRLALDGFGLGRKSDRLGVGGFSCATARNLCDRHPLRHHMVALRQHLARRQRPAFFVRGAPQGGRQVYDFSQPRWLFNQRPPGHLQR